MVVGVVNSSFITPPSKNLRRKRTFKNNDFLTNQFERIDLYIEIGGKMSWKKTFKKPRNSIPIGTNSSSNMEFDPFRRIDNLVSNMLEYFDTPIGNRQKELENKYTVNMIRDELMYAKSEFINRSYPTDRNRQWKDIILSLAKILHIAGCEQKEKASKLIEQANQSQDGHEKMMIPDYEAKIILANLSIVKSSEIIIDRFIDELQKPVSYQTAFNILLSIDDSFKKNYLDQATEEKKKKLFNLSMRATNELEKNCILTSNLRFIKEWSQKFQI